MNKEILTFQTEIGFCEKPKSFSLQETTEQKAKPGWLKYQLFSIREEMKCNQDLRAFDSEYIIDFCLWPARDKTSGRTEKVKYNVHNTGRFFWGLMPNADPVLCNQIKKIIHRDDDLGFVICFSSDTKLSTQKISNMKFRIRTWALMHSPFALQNANNV